MAGGAGRPRSAGWPGRDCRIPRSGRPQVGRLCGRAMLDARAGWMRLRPRCAGWPAQTSLPPSSGTRIQMRGASPTPNKYCRLQETCVGGMGTITTLTSQLVITDQLSTGSGHTGHPCDSCVSSLLAPPPSIPACLPCSEALLALQHATYFALQHRTAHPTQLRYPPHSPLSATNQLHTHACCLDNVWCRWAQARSPRPRLTCSLQCSCSADRS